ncbi:hypothetical protein AMIS_35930 [Actinoplanes missouriensis 431]|uniref:Uncharacterized protein n=1 Tax=Actinoplanes missouriensis (strain ATCC 14538 / DSM 43046 / CBS 188.64 / JCM 3121 / NBRC 102363 / NCIMB 12654 / NRRL B-3342 / UNCC 431) TaxID=512565 RepID=I0H726_ACTM4|nr:hypothetical protein AMIS_35930 [Actinoplanes missouriensis 431]
MEVAADALLDAMDDIEPAEPPVSRGAVHRSAVVPASAVHAGGSRQRFTAAG